MPPKLARRLRIHGCMLLFIGAVLLAAVSNAQSSRFSVGGNQKQGNGGITPNQAANLTTVMGGSQAQQISPSRTLSPRPPIQPRPAILPAPHRVSNSGGVSSTGAGSSGSNNTGSNPNGITVRSRGATGTMTVTETNSIRYDGPSF
jgi:hypothetical protein